MISYPIYKLIHIFGILLMFASLAGLSFYISNGGTKKDNVLRKQSAIAHGVGLFLILLAGFGMLARLQITQFPWPGWVWGKVAIWLVYGGLIAVIVRKPDLAKWMWIILPILGTMAAYFAVIKPF